MLTFKQGQKLSNSSICDHNCVFTAEVVKRTARTVTITSDRGVKRCKIHIDTCGEGEFIFPYGRYSMAPIFRATP